MAKTYDLAEDFERAVVGLLVTSKEFYTRIGSELAADKLNSEQATRIAEIVHRFYKRATSAPCSLLCVSQELRTLRRDGKLTVEDVNDTMDWLEEAIACRPTEIEGVVQQLAAEVREDQVEAAVQQLLSRKKGEDIGKVVTTLQRAHAQGGGKVSKGIAFGRNRANVVELLRSMQVDRLSTGIAELDSLLGGGVKRGEIAVAVGGSGDGKSMFLSQVTSAAADQGRNVFVVTLELDEPLWACRIVSAQTDVLLSTLEDQSFTPADAAKIEAKVGRGEGAFHVKRMDADTATVEEVWAAFDQANEELRAVGETWQYEVLVVDYADRLGHPKDMSKYDGMGYVYERLRLGGVSRKIWVCTASQAIRLDQTRLRSRAKGGDAGLLGLNDLADSQNKVRHSDLILTLNVFDALMRIFVAKNRTGEAGGVTPPLPVDYAFGRAARSSLGTNVETDEGDTNLFSDDWS